DQPAYGVKAIGIDGSARTPDRFEAIAARYVEEVVAERPDGPIVLGGYSVGALVALELALQLQERGREVGPLVVFDMTAPGSPGRRPLLRLVALHAANLVRGGDRGRLAYLRDRWNNVSLRVLSWFGLGVLAAPEIEGVGTLPQQTLKRVWAALQKA